MTNEPPTLAGAAHYPRPTGWSAFYPVPAGWSAFVVSGPDWQPQEWPVIGAMPDVDRARLAPVADNVGHDDGDLSSAGIALYAVVFAPNGSVLRLDHDPGTAVLPTGHSLVGVYPSGTDVGRLHRQQLEMVRRVAIDRLTSAEQRKAAIRRARLHDAPDPDREPTR